MITMIIKCFRVSTVCPIDFAILKQPKNQTSQNSFLSSKRRVLMNRQN